MAQDETPTERAVRVIREEARAEMAVEIEAILDAAGDSVAPMIVKIAQLTTRAIKTHKANL